MKTIRNTLLTGVALSLMLLADAPPESRIGFQLLPDAHAVLGVWRRHARRWAVVGTAAVATSATATAANQASATQAQATAAPPPAPTGGETLPMGTVVSSLPGGCSEHPVGGVEYYKCGSNYYRAVFQGNNLVYVTAKP